MYLETRRTSKSVSAFNPNCPKKFSMPSSSISFPEGSLNWLNKAVIFDESTAAAAA